MSDRLLAAQLRLLADQVESGEAEVSNSYVRFTPPATTYIEVTVELVTPKLDATHEEWTKLPAETMHGLEEGNNKESTDERY